MKIALAQVAVSRGDLDANLETHRQSILAAAAQKAELICFPEMSLPGYGRRPLTSGEERTLSHNEEVLQKLTETLPLTVVLGTQVRRRHSLYIGQKIYKHGQEIGCYLKTHLGQAEQKIYAAGPSLPVFAMTDSVKIGIQLCSDNHYPEMTIQLALQGAQIILAPFAVPGNTQARAGLWQKYLLPRAYDNRVFLAAVNQVGSTESGRTFAGGAVVYGPNGEVLAADFNGRPAILFCDLDLGAYNQFHQPHSPHQKRCFLEGRRPELYKL